MGVTNFITFDAHDPRVQNATPLCGFDNFTPPYQFMRALLDNVPDLIIDKDHMMVISPDEGALDRTTYFANVLGVNIGMFYKRRDYSVIVNGKNPIVAHEFLGDNIDGKDIVIVDDMISSGGSMLDTARQLKEMNARRVFICTTFGLFTDGMAAFDEAYEKGWFDKVITTNLTYQIPELLLPPLLHQDRTEQVPGIHHRLHEPRCFHVQRPDSYRKDPYNSGKIQQARVLFINSVIRQLYCPVSLLKVQKRMCIGTFSRSVFIS